MVVATQRLGHKQLAAAGLCQGFIVVAGVPALHCAANLSARQCGSGVAASPSRLSKVL